MCTVISRRAIVRSLTVCSACAWLDPIFGQPNEPETLRIGGADLEITFGAAQADLTKTELLDWVKQSATAVAGYYGRFPVPKARLLITVREGRSGVFAGRTWGDHGAHTRISMGQRTSAADLKRDWMLTHEFVHYAFPDMPDRQNWIEEGIATYVEPIARVAIGMLDAPTAWFEMVRDMPKGEPHTGDEGLDNTHTWGRTYWGGAIFCLVADVNIHQQTKNTKGLRDALRGILQAGGNIETDWPLERALETGDKAVGGKTLMSLYQEMGQKTAPVDLAALWKELGVRNEGKTAVFDDKAPLASVRRAILS